MKELIGVIFLIAAVVLFWFWVEDMLRAMDATYDDSETDEDDDQ